MSNSEVKVADSIRPYMNEIADRLWSGHATIMVGAGFSKNAKPNHSACSNFPDWTELGDLFYEKVHGKLPEANEKYMNVLKLADEVHAALGRPVLDQLLRHSIPDLDYEPSALHTSLLDLPWTDVLTTNYDTLLERASSSVSSQKFDVVVNKEDLVYSAKPRIIKLHGSFPSDRPFTITEEDYRRYPRDFAPFVNTVQQSLLENTLCLVGFSGDDPNFLQWIGWIRDNLGQRNSPKIYLVGVINLSDAQKKLLEDRNIVVVNMAECTDVGPNDYYDGLEKFFNYLASKKESENSLGWPYSSPRLFPDPNEDREKQFNETIGIWKEHRLSYPGWVVVPEDRRTTLWDFTEHWCNFLRKTDAFGEKRDLEWSYELVWRMDKSLCPTFGDQVAFLTEVLDKYKWMVFAETVSIDQDCGSATAEEIGMWIDLKIHLLRFYREEGFNQQWNDSNECLLKLWNRLSAPQQANVYYDRALFALFNVDMPLLRNQINEWPINESLPFMEAKRAMLFAEIGNIKEALIILSSALEQIRSKLNLKPISNNYSLVSQESYVMLLYKYVKDAGIFYTHLVEASTGEIDEMRGLFLSKRKSEHQRDKSEKPTLVKATNDLETKSFPPEEEWLEIFNNRNSSKESDWNNLLRELRHSKRSVEQKSDLDRWNILKRYKCDPWNEIKIFSSQLERPPIKCKAISTTTSFDIGQTSTTQNIGGGDKEGFFGYTFLRFMEDAGIAFNIPGCSFNKKSGEGAIERISNYSPYWATATLLRVADSKLVDLLYDRSSLSKFTEENVDQLIDNYLSTLGKAQNDIAEGSGAYRDNFGILLAKIVPEILSRLCTKCSSEKRFVLLIFLKSIYESNDKSKYDRIREFTKRLVGSFSVTEYSRLVSVLIDFPILKRLSLVEERDFINPLLFVQIEERHLEILQSPPEEIVDQFIDTATNGSDKDRTWVILSLGKLYDWKLLNAEQHKAFGGALWARLSKYGMPADTGYYNFAFIKLPHPSDVSPIASFKDYLNEAKFPIQNKRSDNGVSMTGGQIPLCHEIIGANHSLEWSAGEISHIAERITEWWDEDKDQLISDSKQKSKLVDILGEFKARFSKMQNVLARVIVPEAHRHSLSIQISTSKRILSELNERDVPALRLSASLRVYESADLEELIHQVQERISSDTEDDSMEAIHAIDFLIEVLDEQTHQHILHRIITILSQKIFWRQTNELSLTLSLMASMVKKFPLLFVEDVADSTLQGLSRISKETNFSITQIEASEQIHLRYEAANLASAIYLFYRDSKKDIPETIKLWQRICQSTEEFSEIRNQWK